MEDIIGAVVILGEIVAIIFMITVICVLTFIFIMNYKDKHTLKDLRDRIKEKYPIYVEFKMYYDGSGTIGDYESNILYSFDSLDELRTHLNE